MHPGSKTPWRAWVSLLATGVAGIALDPLHLPYAATLFFLVALAGLLVRALVRAGLAPTSLRALGAVAGAAGILVGNLSFKYGTWAGSPEAAAVVACGAQLLLWVLGLRAPGGRRRMGRTLVAVTSHAAAFAGTHALLEEGFTEFVGAAYAGSLVLLSLNAYWAHRATRSGQTLRSWEAVYLTFFGLGGVLLATAPIAADGRAFLYVLVALKTGLLVSLALLAGPPHLPPSLRARPGGLAEFVTQAVMLGLLLNVLLVVVVLRFPAAAVPLLVVATAWLLVAVGAEYAALLAGRTRRPHPPADAGGAPESTVVVAAMDEAGTIRRTLEAALALPGVIRVVVAVAARSADGTRDIVRSLADAHPGRVVLVDGGGASKAEDLNQAWSEVHSDLALVLDADEVVEADTLHHAFGILAASPEVGIIQGRKLAPTRTLLDRFVAIERRFSTLFDHPMQDRLFGAAHFGGSAALVRREVPEAAGWWSPESLTEDIEFTVRVHRDTPWHVRYEPRFVVHEQPPHDVGAFLRQRGRWARGWSQVARMHLGLLPRAPPERLPRRTKVGLGWQLLTAVSAPWSVFLPTLVVLWAWGRPLALPTGLALALGFVILPSRLVTFVYPYFRDPRAPLRPRPLRLLGVALGAYLWVVVGWMLQLQALYLELSSAPKVWHPTRGTAAQAGRPDP